MKASCIVAIVVVLLAGCATTNEGELIEIGEQGACMKGLIDEARLAREAAAAKPCCTNFAEMKFDEPKNRHLLALTKDAPVYDFATGRSRYASFDMRRLNVRSLVLTPMTTVSFTLPAGQSCSQSAARLRAIRPVFQWLDDTKQPLGEPTRGVPVVVQGAAAWRVDRPDNSQYLIVYTLPREYGQAMRLDAPPFPLAFAGPGLAASMHPQRTIGPVEFIITATGFLSPIDP